MDITDCHCAAENKLSMFFIYFLFNVKVVFIDQQYRLSSIGPSNGMEMFIPYLCYIRFKARRSPNSKEWA